MLWAVTAITFLATVTVLAALFYALAPGGIGIARAAFAFDSAAAAGTGPRNNLCG